MPPDLLDVISNLSETYSKNIDCCLNSGRIITVYRARCMQAICVICALCRFITKPCGKIPIHSTISTLIDLGRLRSGSIVLQKLHSKRSDLHNSGCTSGPVFPWTNADYLGELARKVWQIKIPDLFHDFTDRHIRVGQ